VRRSEILTDVLLTT